MEENTPTIEHLKAVSDHFKHITTLSSGFILVMATLIEKVFQIPEWRILVAVSFVAFTLAILFSMIVQAYFIDFIKKPSNYSEDPKASIAVKMTLTAWGCFLLGIFSLVLFAMKNFL
jgi:hypothetical protein